MSTVEPLQTFDSSFFSLRKKERSGKQGADRDFQPLTLSAQQSPLCSPTPTTDSMKESEDRSNFENVIYWKKRTCKRNVPGISGTGIRGGFDHLDNSFANHLGT